MITVEITSDDVWQALATILDPEFGVTIVDLGLIYSVECTPERVQVVMTLTTLTCPSGGWIHEGARSAVQEIAGAREVRIELVFDPAWNTGMLSDHARRLLGCGDGQ